MKPVSRAELYAAAGDAAAILCDWDGCLAIDNRLQPGVADFLGRARRIAIISNNSTMSRETCRRLLAREGIRIATENIHLAGHSMLELARQQFGDDPVYLVANAGMRRLAEKLGLRMAQGGARAVLVLRNPRFDYGQLAEAAHHVASGAQFWIANPDLSHPSKERLVPETGALAEAIAAVAGRRPDKVVGKPECFLFEQALATLGLSSGEVVMIGDNPATDIAGASAASIMSLLVGVDTWRGVTAST